MQKHVKIALVLAAALPLMAQTSEPVPAAALVEMQGKWVSRYASDPSTIEVRGNEIFLVTADRSSNPTPTGRVFKILTVARSGMDSTSGRMSYVFGGDCTAFGGRTWEWITDSSGCEVALSSAGFSPNGTLVRTRKINLLANEFVRAQFKDK